METLDRLKIRLGLETVDANMEVTLTEYLDEAATAIKLYLNLDYDKELDSRFVSTQINLAQTYYNRDMAKNVKSESYSEGVVSQSVTYMSSNDYDTKEEQLLSKLARYRRVYARRNDKKGELLC